MKQDSRISIECEYCGKIGRDKDFISYFGPINMKNKFGICYECAKKGNKHDAMYNMQKSGRPI